MKKAKLSMKINCNISKGFTLIEVIIAVSIVIILGTLTVPKVSGYIAKAKDAKIINTSKQIYTAAIWSYNEQGNAFSKDNIKEAIGSVIGNVGVTADSIVVTSNLVTIPFLSDGVSCTLKIRLSDNSYEVVKINDEIFDSNPAADSDT